jgi:DNA-binding LacI/PurR family transcriptional regulator
LEALRCSLLRHGLELRDEWVLSGDYSFEAGSAHARRMLELASRPTALLCSDDMIAVGAIGALVASGLRVPRDCSVVGFDDVVIAQYLTPSLTTIHQDAYGKGQRAAEVLIDVIAHGLKDDVVQETLPTRLVIRKSTAPPAHGGGATMA